MRVLICDDDRFCVTYTRELVEYYFQKKHIDADIYCVRSGEELLADKGRKDIVFLDIEMPGMNGICAGRKLMERNKDTILFLITSYEEYLDDAFRIRAFRFLSKPIDRNRFYRNLEDALEEYAMKSVRILIETKEASFTVESRYIVMVESLGKKVTVHTVQSSVDSIRNMDYWKRILPENCFITTGRGYLVNLKYVKRYDHSVVYLSHGNLRAYLTRRYYKHFKNAHTLFLAGKQNNCQKTQS